MKHSFSPMVWFWLACVGVASFLTWGTLAPTTFSGLPGGFGDSFFGGIKISVNAWSGNLTLLGIQLPNWLPIIAAVGAACVSYARSTGAKFSAALPKGLLFYALGHVALFVFILLASGRGTLGIGSLLTIAALIALFVSVNSSAPPQTPVS